MLDKFQGNVNKLIEEDESECHVSDDDKNELETL